MRHRITRRAERDLKDIYRYTFESFGEGQAARYLRELDVVFELLADNPHIGRLYDGRTHQFVHGKHITLYRVESEQVVIGRIFHGATRR